MRFPDDVPVLSDDVVTLRAHTAADLERIVEQCNDPESVAWTTVPAPYGPEDAVEWVGTTIPAGWSTGADLCFAVDHGGQFVGSVNLRPRNGAEAEVGFGLHPAARGKGVMRRAVDLLLDWGFERQGLSVVSWRANAGNWASRRVAWAVGFHFGPTIPRALQQRGERYDAWTGWIAAGDSRKPKERWFDVPVLETDRLRLRGWRTDDGERLVQAANDERLRRFIPQTPLPLDLAGVPAYLLRVDLATAQGARLAWCVADRQTDRALGNVAIFDFEGPEGAEGAQLGYWAHPDARGSGVLSQAARVVADWALTATPDGLGLRRLYLLSAVSNTASRRVAEQAGFTHVGTERAAATVVDGGFDDNALYDRLATDRPPDVRRACGAAPR
ncbi:MAG: GNAT family N-acetyltransferase [Nocardioidaceae bacterium]